MFTKFEYLMSRVKYSWIFSKTMYFPLKINVKIKTFFIDNIINEKILCTMLINEM
jgi:hypothetical protein